MNACDSNFDLLLRSGHVIDPSQNWNGVADIGIRDGIVAAFGPELDSAGSSNILDATGTYISPGWIDLHGHWYEGGLYGINAELGLNHGVTTAVDAGTAGFANFPAFHDTTILQSRARILAYVHLSCLGLHTTFAEELVNLAYGRPEETAMVVDRYSEVTAGVKVRIGSMTANHGNEAFDMALRAAEMARKPLMVHISSGADERYILDSLRGGDILTHCFHGNQNGMFEQEHRGMISEVRSARERGVIFDIGHGCGSFSWDSAQRAFEHHFWPDTISTDLHRYSVEPPWSVTMPQVLSKFLALGMSLQDVIEKATVAPARALGRPQLGALGPGSPADLVQFKITSGDFVFTDSAQRPKKGDRMIEPLLCLRGGIVYRPGDVQPPMRPLYPCDQSVFPASAEASAAIQRRRPEPRKP
jgi:dihydroorotase